MSPMTLSWATGRLSIRTESGREEFLREYDFTDAAARRPRNPGKAKPRKTHAVKACKTAPLPDPDREAREALLAELERFGRVCGERPGDKVLEKALAASKSLCSTLVRKGAGKSGYEPLRRLLARLCDDPAFLDIHRLSILLSAESMPA